MKPNKLRRVTAAALVGVLLLTQTAVAAAPTVETDESVYINLDYYGVPTDTRVVKGVSLNGHDSFTDYGDYSDVYNMSTYDQPDLSAEGAVTWTPSNAGQRFYYECIPSGSDPMELPWNFDVSYKLNGVPVAAEKCAGANGLIEMTIHAMPNDKASEYYKNNMMLVCGTGIDMSKMLSIDAPGAQVQSMGTYKLVVFMGMPGEENTFTVRIGSDDFESMGLLLFMAPATLSSLDLLSDMRDIKDRLGDSGDNLYEGLSSMLETLQSMQGGMNTLSSGISGINSVRQQLIASRGDLDPKTDAALDALDALAGKSTSLIPELNSMKSTLTTLNATTNSMLNTFADTSDDVTNYQALLRNIKNTLNNLNDLFDDIDDETGGSNWFYLSELRTSVSNLTSDLGRLKSSMETLKKALSTMQSLQSMLLSAVTGSESFNNIVTQLVTEGLLTPADAKSMQEMLPELSSTLSGLTDAMNGLLSQLETSTSGLQGLLDDSEAVLKHLENIDDVVSNYNGLPQDIIGDGKQLTELANETLETISTELVNIPSLTTSLSQLTSDTTSAIDKGTDLMTTLSKMLDATSQVLTQANNTLRSVRDDSDQSLQTSIDGLLDVLDRAARSNSSKSLQDATDSIHSAADDAEKDLEEDTNVLNIDSEADLQSVTSSQNPSPASLQFILRTQEISNSDDDDSSTDESATTDEGVLARIANIFKKLGSAIASVFSSDE